MDITQALPLLGGICPQQFMKHYWQKKPLLVRQALPQFKPLLSRSELLTLAGDDEVAARLVVQHPGQTPAWQLKHGPFQRKALPPFKQSGWTILLQGVDLHDESVHQLMNQFRFVPDARLDDVMISYATDGGGVGPHIDSYDVFLLQAQGRRLWRIGRQKKPVLQDGVPLKILTNFVPEDEFVVEPGDLLYLPPGYAHDGIAQGECMTYSIGFRIPKKAELARELLQRVAEQAEDELGEVLYRDADQPAVGQPAEIPAAMQEFAHKAVQAALQDPRALTRGLGEYMTEPKPNVWFEPLEEDVTVTACPVRLDRRSKMMFDHEHIFINGESFLAAGRDAVLMRTLANQRNLTAQEAQKLSKQAQKLLAGWAVSGWLHLN